MHIREDLDTQSIRMSSRFDTLDQQTQQILVSILESSSTTTTKISRDLREQMTAQTVAFTQLLSRIESLNKDQNRLARSNIYQEISADVPFGAGDEEEIQGITADIEMLGVSDAAEHKVRTAIHDEILQSLRYPAMTNRYEDVLEAHPDTFEWAFQDSSVNRHKWNNLSHWLEGDDGIYWINGKAGSGKSTLMKHMFDDDRTRERLKVWAKDKPLCVATFFFWNSGTKEQKSQCGLLRALLFQVLKSYPDLSPIILPVLWAKLYSKAVSQPGKNEESMDSWPVRQLMTAFRALIHQKSVSLKICFLIDGLDEFDGDHEEIARLFQEISSFADIKVCLSSRPWVVFERLFENCPSLRLQYLTYRDIERYVQDNLMENAFFRQLARENPEDAPALVQEIVDKADGVFLWVKLVVRSLLNGIRNRDEMSHLWERLRLLPRELEPLYSRLLDLVEPLYLPWVSKAFQILRNNRDLGDLPFGETSAKFTGVEGLTVAAFYLAMNQELDESTILRMGDYELKLKLRTKCKDTIVHLTARCAGLLEVSNIKGTDLTGPESPIVFFHRTARDFLYTKVHWSKLLIQTINTDFNPSVSMMRSCIRQALVNYVIYQKIEQDDMPFAESIPLPQCRMDKETKAMAKDFIIYAYNANDHMRTATTQIALLDQFENIMGMSWINGLYPSLKGFPNSLEIAALFNLRAYMSARIYQDAEEKTKRMATDVLRYLLPDIDCHVKYGIPLPSIEMVSFLLQLGADPNDRGPSRSPWENTLRFSRTAIEPAKTVNDKKTEADDTFDLTAYDTFDFMAYELNTYDAKPLQLRYLQIMEMLVLSGADPEHLVTTHYEFGEYSAWSLTEDFLIREFPLEAAPLLRALRDALKTRTSIVKRKREPSEDKAYANEDRCSKRRVAYVLD